MLYEHAEEPDWQFAGEKFMSDDGKNGKDAKDGTDDAGDDVKPTQPSKN